MGPEISSSNTNICSDVSCEQVMENILLLEDNVEDLLKQGVYNVTKRGKNHRHVTHMHLYGEILCESP